MKLSAHFWRRISQWACLAGFLWLFLQTEYRGLDQLPYPVGLLFRIDPLAALADLLAPGAFHWQLLWPALLVLVLTAFFGRFFCGWICPLGTTLDASGRLIGRGRNLGRPAWRGGKYYLLFGLIAAGLAGVQQFGLLDPLALFLRALTLAFYPVYNLFANSLFDFFYDHRVPLVSPLLDNLYPFWRDHLMAFQQPVFLLGLFTLVVFFAVLLLEKVERRFWCKNLCPLGALLGICAKHALYRREPAELCTDCRLCSSACRMDATVDRGHLETECIRCYDCQDYCPAERIRFASGAPGRQPGGIDLGRRGVVTSLAAGVVGASVVRIAPVTDRRNPYLLRPPGAVAEAEFLRRCVRCGECMKVCIGRALQPALLEAGPAGLWTPQVVPRIGYCEYNCTLCGQVCPTGAISKLPIEKKRQFIIGLAVFDKNRCLPLAKGVECLVCEEHCPTGEKAIVFDEKHLLVDGRLKTVKLPRVVEKRCIGCGICETKCPLEGASAIRVVNQVESRRPRVGLEI